MNLQNANHPDVRSARGLVTAALVLFGVFGIIFLLAGIFAFPFLILAFLSFIALIIVYTTVQEPLKRGDVRRASNPALVTGILSLLFANIISGILLLVAYARISRAEAAIRTSGWGAAPVGGLSPSAPIPTGSGVAPGDERYCSSCGSALTPSDQYCTSCGTRVPS